MSEEAKDAIVSIESGTVLKSLTEADHKFILAFVMIIAYTVMLIIPVLTNNVEMFKMIAATTSGAVGTIIGYYFGTKRERA